jgi:Protein of unknown function (DUF3072)
MSEFASETSQAAQEEVEDIQADPAGSETLGASTGGNDALEKDPAEWVSGDDPITPAQKSYLDTLARQAGEELPADLTKAEASQHIERLKAQLGQNS